MQITVVFESLEEFQKYFGQPAPQMQATIAPPKAKSKAKAEVAAVDKGTGAIVGAAPDDQKAEEQKPAAPAPAAAAAEKITKTDVRAVALKLSKAGKSQELKAIFSEFGAEKLSDIKESDYPAVMAKLGEINAE